MQAKSLAEAPAPLRAHATELSAHWPEIRKLWRSSMFGAFATSGPEGPQVTPIGSVYLHPDEPRGYYHPVLASRLPKALASDGRFELLFVDTNLLHWFSGMIRGGFERWVGVRLKGQAAGPRRAATEEEVARFRKLVRPLSWTRGHDLIWKDVRFTQELRFDAIVPVRFGRMRHGAKL